MNKLEMFDYAFNKTMEKHPEFGEHYFVRAAELFTIKNYSNSFTNTDGARNCVQELKKEDLICEMLKNMIKVQAVNDKYGLTQALKVPEQYSSKLSGKEKDLWFYNTLSNVPLEFITSIVDPNRINSNPDDERVKKITELISYLAFSFVHTRYYDKDYLINRLDSPDILSEKDLDTINRIDNYYNGKRISY